jgi:glutathione peroxidase
MKRMSALNTILVLLGFSIVTIAACADGPSAAQVRRNTEMKSIYDFTMKDIDGKDVPLSDFKGNVVLVVNVASKCGFTPQYKGLEELYMSKKQSGFLILGFPANDFLFQEPGNNEDIKQFCSLTYGVSFPMFSKISVKGKAIDPLYVYLTSKDTDPKFGGPITWNFNKFLIGKDGSIIDRFESKDEPLSDRVLKAVDAALAVN